MVMHEYWVKCVEWQGNESHVEQVAIDTYASFSSPRVKFFSSGGTPRNSHTRGMMVSGCSESCAFSMFNIWDCNKYPKVPFTTNQQYG